MLRWRFTCKTCGTEFSRKTSGSIRPKDWDKEVPKEDVICNCGEKMVCTGVRDSSIL